MVSLQELVKKYKKLKETIEYSALDVRNGHIVLDFSKAASTEEFVKRFFSDNKDYIIYGQSSHKGCKFFAFYGEKIE